MPVTSASDVLRRLPARRLVFASVAGSLIAATALATPIAQAAPGGKTDKVRICHRTNALTNPYVSIEVAQSSVDGDGGNDKGQGDHYLNHVGPVWTTSTAKGDDWGDIIPPIPGVHDGRNWTVAGQAIWSAGCRPVQVTDEDADGIDDVVDPDSDGDRIPDVTDTDDDGDAVPDATDPDENPTTDTDGDRIPDPVDSDDDGDGLTDNAECDAKTAAETATDPTATQPADATTGTSTGSSTETTNGTPGNNAATGVGQTTNGASARALCGSDGNVTPPDETTPDTDGDGTPNEVDRDDDNDGTPDTSDRDEDGDANPDVTDPDDDGDGVPDAVDEDNPPVEPSSVVDTDGDGTPDSRDRDDDGDGIADPRDKDADGDGTPETTPQRLAESVVLPGRIDAGETTVLFRGEPLTVAGVPALATIACVPSMRAAAKAPTGDLGAGQVTRMLCDVTTSGKTTRILVKGAVPTTVVVTLTSSAVGPYEALREVRVLRVGR